MSEFAVWAKRWMDLAHYKGPEFPDDRRIEKVIALWHEEVPDGWQRKETLERLVAGKRFTRKIARSEPKKELAIEAAVLAEGVPPTELLGARIIDGVNAVPLVKGVRGLGEVEADLLLLLGEGGRYRLACVEVKVDSNHAWWAAVENLRQVRLILASRVRELFTERNQGLALPPDLPVAAIVLAPPDFYTHAGQKANAVGPANQLFQRVRHELDIEADLATFDASVGVQR